MVNDGAREPGDSAMAAVDELAAAIADVDAITVIDSNPAEAGSIEVALKIDTSSFPTGDGGLPVHRYETVIISISNSFPLGPPRASVSHTRWAGFPHVLQGSVLCLYLDPATEWHPSAGIAGFLERLWDWFAAAIGGEFDPATSLYHPVGGVLHRTAGAPTLVVEPPLPYTDAALHFRRICLRERSPHRIDLAAWYRDKAADYTHIGLLVVLPGMLPFGAGNHLSLLTAIVGHQQSNGARKRLLAKLRETADHLEEDQPLDIVIAVPNPAIADEARLHLLAARIAHDNVAAAIDAATARGRSGQQPPNEPAIEWLYVDDLRPGVTFRRDKETPIGDIAGSTVEIWGCGALGSVLAEMVARAGAGTIVLRDPSFVTKGLLVRQNYTEADVGRPKVDALADRLRALNDQLVVRPVHEQCQLALVEPPACEFIIDATVSTSVATFIELAQRSGRLDTPIAQVATDDETATLGILTVCQPGLGDTNNDLDDAARAHAHETPALAPFAGFWHHDAVPPVTPTKGCSVPTFRGSSADTATISAIGLSLLSLAMRRRVSGAYLFAAPHSPYDVPSRVDIPAPPQATPPA